MQKKKRNERTKLDLCQGREMKSTKKSSLFANNPTIPEIDEYVQTLLSQNFKNSILGKSWKQPRKRSLAVSHRWTPCRYILISYVFEAEWKHPTSRDEHFRSPVWNRNSTSVVWLMFKRDPSRRFSPDKMWSSNLKQAVVWRGNTNTRSYSDSILVPR